MAADAGPSAPQGTGLLTKAFDIIDLIAQHHGHIGTREISELTGIARPTLYRILSALTARGVVRCDPETHCYFIGYRTLDIAQQVWSSSDLTSVSAGELRRLRDVTGETAYLAVAEGNHVLSIGRFEGVHPHRSSAALGSLKPMYCTSQGKAMLAFMPPEKRERILALPRERLTEHTITDRAALEAELGTVYHRGYAIDDEEIVLGTRCVGAPVIDRDGAVIAAISIAGPAFRITHERVKALAKELTEVARVIGSQVAPKTPERPRSSEFFPVTKQPAFAGASPHWDTARQSLWWIDRLAPAVFESGSQGTRIVREFSSRLDALVLSPWYGPFVFLGDSVARLRDGAEFCAPAAVQAAAHIPGDGRLLLAVDSETEGSSLLVKMTHNGTFSPMTTLAGPVSDLVVASDGRTAYAASAERGTVVIADLATGKSRVLARMPAASGRPRSCTLDAAGRLWVALTNGWSVARIDELGEIAERLPVPVPNPTGLCFGGEDGRTLYVTTARIGLDRFDLSNAPLSGQCLRFVE